MLNITIGRNALEAENVIGIWGAAGSGKSFVLSKIAFQISTRMRGKKECMFLDEKMAEYFGEDMELYLRTFAALADGQEFPILIIDNLEIIKEKHQEFYEILKKRVTAGTWSVIYASGEMITDFRVEKNIVLHTLRDQNAFLADVISPAVNRMEDVTVIRFKGRN